LSTYLIKCPNECTSEANCAAALAAKCIRWMSSSVFMILVVVLHYKYAQTHKKPLMLLGEQPEIVGE